METITMAKLEQGTGNIQFIEVMGFAYYAQVQKPNKDAVWSVEIVPATQEDADILVKSGLTPVKLSEANGGGLKSYPNHKGLVYRFKRSLVNKSTQVTRTPPEILDSQGTPTSVLIGNGSKIQLSGTVRPYTFLGKSGVTGSFHKVQIADLVPYSSLKSTTIEGSFVASADQVKTSEDDNSTVDTDTSEDLGVLE